MAFLISILSLLNGLLIKNNVLQYCILYAHIKCIVINNYNQNFDITS